LMIPTGIFISGQSGVGSQIDLTDGAFVIWTDGGAAVSPFLAMNAGTGSSSVLLNAANSGNNGGALILTNNFFGGAANLLLSGLTGLYIEEASGSHFVINLQTGSFSPSLISTDQINIVTGNSNGIINLIPGASGGLFLNTPTLFQGPSGNVEIIVASTSTLQVTIPNKAGTMAFTRDMTIQLLSKHTAVNFNTTSDTTLTLAGTTTSNTAGTAFVITDIVVTNSSVNLTTASDGEWWTGASRSGSELATTSLAGFSTLVAPNNYVSATNGQITNSASTTVGTSIFFSLGTPQGAPATADIYVYGYVLA
jgi:hypothetical protein